MKNEVLQYKSELENVKSLISMQWVRVHLTFLTLPTKPPDSLRGSCPAVAARAISYFPKTGRRKLPTLEIALEGVSTFNCDMNYDGTVNFAELGSLNANFGLTDQDPGYNIAFDMNGDGAINFGDLGVLNAEFGRTLNPPAQQVESPTLPTETVPTKQVPSIPSTALPEAITSDENLTAQEYARHMASPNQIAPDEVNAPVASTSYTFEAVYEELGGGSTSDEEFFDFTEELWSDLEVVLALL